MLRTALKSGAKITGAALTTGAGVGLYLYETDEGYERAFKAYGTMVPVVLNYRLLEAKDKLMGTSDEEWRLLDDFFAERTVARLGELNGVYTKYCQTASGFHNTFSEVWINEFRKLENEVPPRPVETVHETIRQETGKEIDEIFEEFDPVPLGSASIGQVHKAKLKKDGRTVAVKVQYSDAEKLFQEDVHTIRSFCTIFAPEHVVTLDALEKQNALEMDYLLEAKNLRDVGNNMKKHGLMPREVVVPQPISDLSTRKMLVMDYLEGPKLSDGLREYFEEWAVQHGTTFDKLEEEARRKVLDGGIPARYEGHSATAIALYRQSLKLYNLIAKSSVTLYNGTLGWLLKPLKYPEPKKVPPNIPRIIDTLMRVHGYQLMADGIFQCDPHGRFRILPNCLFPHCLALT